MKGILGDTGASFSRGCVGKQRYGSKGHANAASRRVTEATGKGGTIAYKCRHCGGWHFGHNRRRRA